MIPLGSLDDVLKLKDNNAPSCNLLGKEIIIDKNHIEIQNFKFKVLKPTNEATCLMFIKRWIPD